MASNPMGKEVRKTNRQLTNCKKTPKSTRPIRPPKRAATTGTAKARPRSVLSKTMAKIALELAVISAPPIPTNPLQKSSWLKLRDVAAIVLPTQSTTAPIR